MIKVLNDYVNPSSDWIEFLRLGYIIYSDANGLLKILRADDFALEYEYRFEDHLNLRLYPYCIDKMIYLRYGNKTLVYDFEVKKFKETLSVKEKSSSFFISSEIVVERNAQGNETIISNLKTNNSIKLDANLGIYLEHDYLIVGVRKESDSFLLIYDKATLEKIKEIALGNYYNGRIFMHITGDSFFYADGIKSQTGKLIPRLSKFDLSSWNLTWRLSHMPKNYLKLADGCLVINEKQYSFLNLEYEIEFNWTPLNIYSNDTISIGKSSYVPESNHIVSSSSNRNIYLFNSSNLAIEKIINYDKIGVSDFFHKPYYLDNRFFIPSGLDKMIIYDTRENHLE